jgi:hypothetical protein
METDILSFILVNTNKSHAIQTETETVEMRVAHVQLHLQNWGFCGIDAN